MNLHLIVGEDDYLVTAAARKLLQGYAVEEIDSNGATNAEAQLKEIAKARESFLTPPFLEPNKATWWRNVRFLPGADKLAEAVKTALEALAGEMAANPLPDNQRMVITGPKLLKTSLFAKALQPVAEIAVFTPLKGRAAIQQAVATAIDHAQELGIGFEPGAADALVSRVGTDTRSLMMEVSKLRDYLGENRKTITREDVDLLASPGAGMEPDFWAITDAIGARDAKRALAAVDQFAGDNGFAVMITTTIERFLRQLIDLELLEGTLAPFQVQKLRAFKRNWTLNELRSARFRFMNLRERAVTGGEAAGELVYTEIVRACAARRNA